MLVSGGVQLQVTSAYDASLQSLTLCLVTDENVSYPVDYVLDFGFSFDLVQVVPAGLQLEQRLGLIQGNKVTEWCARVDFSNVHSDLTVFVVAREPNYQSGSSEAFSESEIAMSYTLGAVYSVLLALIVGASLYFYTIRFAPLYIFSLVWFFCLCVFRLVYAFALPSGTWSNTEASYVVFELPTFFYFSALILCMWSLMRVLVTLVPTTPRFWKPALIISFILVWLLFIAVAIAVGVLANQSDTSPCPGRVAASDTLATQLQNLSIAYQSIVIAFIFAFSLASLFAVGALVRSTSASTSSFSKNLNALKEVLKDSLTFSLGFLVRSILFLVYLAADLSSTPYIFVTLLVTEVLVIFLLLCYWLLRSQVWSENNSSSGGLSSPSRHGTGNRSSVPHSTVNRPSAGASPSSISI